MRNPKEPLRRSELFPLFSRDARLAQQFREESRTDVFTMRVRDGEGKSAALHEFVFATRKGAGESQAAQTGDQFTTFDGAKVGIRPALPLREW